LTSRRYIPSKKLTNHLSNPSHPQYSGAKVLLIDNVLPWFAVEQNAAEAGGYQGHSQRQNSLFSSYTRAATEWSYRMGDFAARSLPPRKDHVKMTVLLANSSTIETINAPFISRLTVGPFTSGADLWDKNCKATDATNGKDYFASTTLANNARGGIELVDSSPPKFAEPIAPEDRKHSISSFIDVTALTDISLPPALNPPDPVSGNGTARFYMQGKVGVLALGSFSTGAGYNDWFTILSTGLNELKNQGATHLIVDVVSGLVIGWSHG
jgi:hypothetical protein